MHTFGWYLREMIDDVRAKHGIPIISGPLPQNNFRGKTFQTDWPFARDAEAVAKQKSVEYIDHTKYTVDRFQALGSSVVNKYFPEDHTHTNDAGARGMYPVCIWRGGFDADPYLIVAAETFVTAALCAKSQIGKYISEKGRAVKQQC